MGGGRKRGRYGFSVLGLMGCAAMIAASEHFVNTVEMVSWDVSWWMGTLSGETHEA